LTEGKLVRGKKKPDERGEEQGGGTKEKNKKFRKKKKAEVMTGSEKGREDGNCFETRGGGKKRKSVTRYWGTNPAGRVFRAGGGGQGFRLIRGGKGGTKGRVPEAAKVEQGEKRRERGAVGLRRGKTK